MGRKIGASDPRSLSNEISNEEEDCASRQGERLDEED